MILDGFAPFLQDFATLFFSGLEYVLLNTLTHMPYVEQVQGVLAAGTYPFGNTFVAVANKYIVEHHPSPSHCCYHFGLTATKKFGRYFRINP